MGLLDDAIREHLDLKRRRGADPAEIERAEHEALGPVRRAPDEVDPLEQPTELATAAATYDEPGDWDEPELDEDLEPYELEEDEAREPLAEAEHPAVATQATSAPFDAESPFDEHDELFASDHEAGAPPEGELPPLPETPPPVPASQQPSPAEPSATDEPSTPVEEPASDETAEYDVERALEEHPAESDEDVLEETPEFLQDTPDHDRLWFEQRPPRDFDLGD